MAGRRRNAIRRNWPANLYSKRDGYFWYRNPENGKTRGLGRDKDIAFREAIAANLVLASRTRSDLAAWVSGVETKTLAECADEYLLRYASSDKAKSSVMQAKSDIRLIKADDIAHLPVDRITTADIHKFLASTKNERGVTAARRRRTTLENIFNLAIQHGLIGHHANPVAPTESFSAPVKRKRLSLDEFEQIRHHGCRWLQNAMNLALVSGQSRYEVASARFKDFKDGYWYCERKKTGAKIRIPVTLRLDAIGLTLEDVLAACRDKTGSQYLIHHERDRGKTRRGAKVNLDSISEAFSKARDAAGIVTPEGKDPPTFHEIRSLAERLYEKEQKGNFTQKLLGHKSPKMTAVYHDSRGLDWIEVVPT